MTPRSSICVLAACLVASCADLPKTATPEAAPPPPVKKPEEPVAPVTPVSMERHSEMRTPDDTAKLPTGQEFIPSADPRTGGGATIHVTPPSDPKPEPSEAKPADPKLQ